MADDKCDDCGEPMADHDLELELGVPADDLEVLILGAIAGVGALEGEAAPGPAEMEEIRSSILARLGAKGWDVDTLDRVLGRAQRSLFKARARFRQHTARNN